MRWLWQYGSKWIGSQVLNEAKRAAAEKITGDDEEAPDDETNHTTMAVVCESKLLFDAVADVLSRSRRIEGDRFATCSGKLAGKQVVVAMPLAKPPNHLQLVTAIVDGHHPGFVLSAGEGASLSPDLALGTIVVARRIIDATNKALRLDGTAPNIAGLQTGVVATPTSEREALVDGADAPIVEDSWSEPVARACQQVRVAMMAASVVLRPSSALRSAEAAALERQSSLAGRAGVLAGMLWKKRSGIRDVWNEKEAAWEASNNLAKLAQHLVKASAE